MNINNNLTWEQAAKQLGELLSETGPANYYSMCPKQWLEWAKSTLSKAKVKGES